MKNSLLYLDGLTGCADGGCIFQDNRNGMHTNGGCSCARELRRHPHGLNAIRTIHYLRNQLMSLNSNVIDLQQDDERKTV